jgi:hypothetical protein
MKASFSVVVSPIPDRLFLVPVGTVFGPLKMFLLHRQHINSGLKAIVVFVTPSVGTLISNCYFLRSVEEFPFTSELFKHLLAQFLLAKFFCNGYCT